MTAAHSFILSTSSGRSITGYLPVAIAKHDLAERHSWPFVSNLLAGAA